MLPKKQFFGVALASLARSPLVGFPKKPLLTSWFRVTMLPLALKKQTSPSCVPPWQVAIGGGVSLSG